VKQIVQNPKSGALELVEVPAPALAAGQVLVRNHFSVVSPGTERMAIDFARKSMLGKARSRPDLVRQVVRKLQQDGPLPTYRTVMNRLDAAQPLGYSCAGVVEAVGDGVVGFTPGDRVACAGAGYANHAEWVVVPENLVARVPDALSLDRAAFATLGAIAMQGLRVAEPQLGEVVAVIGLGMIGQLAVQLLRANGCRVLAIDTDPARVEQALSQRAEWGAAPGDDHEAWKLANTAGAGADFAIVAAASSDSAPLQLAAELCRLKGRVVAVGATAMDLERRSFYDKELELRMSMSYGPGRYDFRYEESGIDYPRAYVRWTENRNLEAFLALAHSGAIDPTEIASETVDFAKALQTYDDLASGRLRSLAVLFRYDGAAPLERSLVLREPAPRTAKDELGVGFLGAGNYAKAVLLPAVQRTANLRKLAVVTSTGASARRTAEKFGFASCATDPAAVLDDPEVDLVFVATRHDSHAELADAALRAGKAVWLEKPAALDEEQLLALEQAATGTGGFLAVGYNRRFSSHARRIRDAFAGRGPLAIHYTVVAGPTPSGTWITDPATGGGRIVGEVCHFIDLLLFVSGSRLVSVQARSLGRDPAADDSVVATLAFADGSAATLHYLAQASPALPKERFEVSGGGHTARCENYRETHFAGSRPYKTMNQDKGQDTAVAEVIAAVKRGAPSPFALEDLLAVSRATFAIERARWSGEVVPLDAGAGDASGRPVA
jgi:predicted dehydrogenase